MRVIRVAKPTVGVKVQPAWQATVLNRRQQVRIVQPRSAQTIGKGGQRDSVQIVVYPGQQHCVGAHRNQPGDHRFNLRVGARPDVAEQQPRSVAREVGVPCGKAQALRLRPGCGKDQEKEKYQAVAIFSSPCSPVRRRCSRIISATRPIAIPRMNRLAGRKDHAAIVQIKTCGFSSVIGAIPLVAA
jgi:hypothetical protein